MVAVRNLVRAGAIVVAVGLPVMGCTTTEGANKAPLSSSKNASADTTTNSAEREVELLRDRVARLETRLADVDGRFALLTARPAAPAASSSSPPRDRPASVGLGLGATTVPQAAPQKLDGNRSIDLPPRGGLPEPEADEGEVVLQGSGDDVHLVAGPSATYTNHGAASSSDTKGATDLYATAQSRMKEGKFKDALSAYQEVLDRFPKHRLADNAMYWAGWCEQQGKDHKGAIAVWQKLPLRFPKSAKVADSLYGMALSHEALGEAAEAETLYREIVAQYPKAEAWKNAKKALARLHPGTDP